MANSVWSQFLPIKSPLQVSYAPSYEDTIDTDILKEDETSHIYTLLPPPLKGVTLLPDPLIYTYIAFGLCRPL